MKRQKAKQSDNIKILQSALETMKKNAEQKTDYNCFMDALYDLYEHYYLDDEKPYTMLYEALIYRIKNKKEGISFDMLWDFATAIRLMEKVYFYHNDVTAGVCCDSELNSDKRILIINPKYFLCKELNITIKLTLYVEQGDQIINLEVFRPYGRKMNSTFLIINRETVFNDTHDQMLMNSVNEIIEQSMIYLMELHKEKIETKTIFKDIVYIPD